jgi:hypothetical protein
MAYDPITKRIFPDGSEISWSADQGVYLFHFYRDICLNGDAPPEIKHDWELVEKWLGCSGRNLSEDDFICIKKAWLEYYAVGVAPTTYLQPIFDEYAMPVGIKVRQKDKPPTRIMYLFLPPICANFICKLQNWIRLKING